MEQTRTHRAFRVGTPFSPAMGLLSAPVNKKSTTHPKIPRSFATLGNGTGPGQDAGTTIGLQQPEGGENGYPLIHAVKKKSKPPHHHRKKKHLGKHYFVFAISFFPITC